MRNLVLIITETNWWHELVSFISMRWKSVESPRGLVFVLQMLIVIIFINNLITDRKQFHHEETLLSNDHEEEEEVSSDPKPSDSRIQGFYLSTMSCWKNSSWSIDLQVSHWSGDRSDFMASEWNSKQTDPTDFQPDFKFVDNSELKLDEIHKEFSEFGFITFSWHTNCSKGWWESHWSCRSETKVLHHDTDSNCYKTHQTRPQTHQFHSAAETWSLWRGQNQRLNTSS